MPNRLSKLFSSSDKEKEALAEAERKTSRGDVSDSSSQRPPSYQQDQSTDWDRENFLNPPDITAGFSNLNISAADDGYPSKEECIAHLKVLECFYKMRQSVGSNDGLFGIEDKLVTGQTIPQNDKTGELLAKLAEKRWAIYLQRAVDRFEMWWTSVTPEAHQADRTRLESQGRQGWLCKIENLGDKPLTFDKRNLPPPDVIMVWHAFMLNPRAYLEDCLRNGRMALWHCQMPWQAASECIDSKTFAFDVDATSKTNFSSNTGLPWDNLANPDLRVLYCPRCKHQNKVPWTTCARSGIFQGITDQAALERELDLMLSSGNGFCDKNFGADCEGCAQHITHDTLKGAKFAGDIERLLQHDVPMGGTILGIEGIPWQAHGQKDISTETIMKFPNELFKQGLGTTILEQSKVNYLGGSDVRTVTGIRDVIEAMMKDKKYMRKVRGSASSVPQRKERISIRKMMSRYWDNSSPFALDLVGAVIRQGSFIEKMHNIDWLHSPALPNTMNRLIQKYAVFMQIMGSHPTRMAVPTLDVDLAWHTHQLNPPKYMEYTIKRTRQFIDHDDKVAETKLNESFAWTSKTYQKLTGQPYSECTCWYCEAVRESHTSSASRLFNTTSAQVANMLHGTEQDPRKSVHISAHNAVRPTDDSSYNTRADSHAKALEAQYQKACERAKRKGKPAPKRDDYYYSDAYGYPVYIPAYAPYYYMPYAPMYYPVTPGCMAVGAGAAGNCCAGTCGGGVAAGGCAGAGGGGCAGGGAAGGCGGGGGGGGGCGGGGGGGCGGGGGGC